MWSACRWVSTALTSLQVELVDELDVAVDLFQHRIDDQRLAAVPAGQEVGVGAGDAVEELAEDHNVLADVEEFSTSPAGR